MKDLVFAYCRESQHETHAGKDESRLELQIEAIKNEFPEEKYDLVFFKDNRISGKDTNRPAFQEMMKSLADKKPSLVVCTKIDRLSRSAKDLLNTVETITSKKIGFKAIQQKEIDTTTPTGRLVLQLLGSVAEFERSLINERLAIGIAKAREKGVKFGRPIGSLRSGKTIDSKKVMELHEKKLSACAISKTLGCSITPVLRIIKENEVKKL